MFKNELEEKENDYSGLMQIYLHPDGGFYTCIWSEEKKIDVLSHECLHAVNYVLTTRGICLSDETDEVYAHYLGMLIRSILKKEKI